MELENFLQQQGAEGRCDSEGAFTIDVKVAERKLAAFQLPTSQSWILVLVQAAHRGGAKHMKVTQRARESIIQISGAQPWSWSDLRSVLDGEPTTDGALLAYAVVVRALTGHEDLTRFRVKSPDGTSALWSDGRFRIEHSRIEDVLLEGKTVFEVSHLGEFPERRSVFFENRRCAREQLVALGQALVKSCFASALSLTLDGLKVPGIHLGGALPPCHKRVPLVLLPLEDYRIPSIPLSAALSSAQAELLEEASISESSRTLDSQRVLSALLCVSIVLKGRKGFLHQGRAELAENACDSRLLWIQDGVVVHSDRLDLGGGLEVRVVLSAAGLRTDLSGLKLVLSDQVKERRQMVAEMLRERLTELCRGVESSKEEHRADLFGLSRVNSRQLLWGETWLGRLATAWERGPQPQLGEDQESLERDLLLLGERLYEALARSTL